jgi:hypothetical protein
LTVLLFLSVLPVSAKDPLVLSLGVKLTHCFDEREWQWGFEASVVKWSPYNPWVEGVVFSVDWHEKRKRMHFGYEMTGWYSFGLQAGPSIIIDDSTQYFGFSLFGYVGALLYLQSGVTVYSKDVYGDISLAAKYPIILDGTLELFGH